MLNIIIIFTFIFVLVSCPSALEHDEHFFKCLSQKFSSYSSVSKLIYTPNNTSYSSILRFSIQNLRFASDSTPKPLAVITPRQESQISIIIYCAKENNMEIRIRSGGHDYEALSYVSRAPFVVVDLINFHKITVNAEEKSAWVETGATIGSLYFKIAEKSPTLGFPAGYCPSVCVGGHFSGGGYGMLLRKHGLAADQVIDARIIDASGRILERKSMGEDLFWAIRGGGAANFGVITAWKVRLVDVLEKVTVFSTWKTMSKNTTLLIHRWQHVAPKLDKDLLIRVLIIRNVKVKAYFNSIFLGGIDKLLPIMKESFPELGLVRKDCHQMSWIQSILFFNEIPMDSPQLLLNRTQTIVPYFKAKSDYVQQPIPKDGLEGIWRLLYELEANNSILIFTPYGGRMDEIPESAIPFPHRAGNLYKIQYLVYWKGNQIQDTDRYVNWMRRLYSWMTPYVSKSPRTAYVNYRDLDIGVNNNEGPTSYEQASIWGFKYFKGNFDRLVRVKTVIDPDNFFKNEQSFPPLPPKIKYGH